MKLNSPWKALFWEEFYISGSISFLLLFIGLALAFIQKYLDPHVTYYLSDIDIFTYALPGLNGLLILLVRGNFGELRTGYQKRLFYLPINVFLPVTLILFLRLGLLLFHVFVLRSVCIYLFFPRNSFVGYQIFNHIFDRFFLINLATDGSLFLFLQLFVWLFHYSKPIFYILIILIVAIVLRIDSEFLSIYSFGYYSYLTIRRFFISHPLVTLAISVAFVYPASLLIIKCYRHNILVDFLSVAPNLTFLNPFKSRTSRIKPFKSEFSSVFWYELHYHKLFLLKWTFLLWLAVNLYSWFDVNDRYGNWMYTDFNYVFKYFLNTAFIKAPFIALCLASIYCYLRYTLRMGKEHEKYSGLTKHVPINEYYSVFAYLSVLFIDVLFAVGFVFVLNAIYIATGKPFSYVESYPLLSNLGITFRNILHQPIYLSITGIIETLSIFILSYLTLSFLLWAILACKEILPVLGGWLLLYGYSDSILFTLERLTMKKDWVWHDVAVYLFNKIQFLVHILHPIEANYLFLIYILCLFLILRVYQMKLLKKTDWLYVLFLFTIIFVSIYPWNYKVDSIREQLWLMKLYIGFTIVLLLPWLSVLLRFFGFRWHRFWKQPNFAIIFSPNQLPRFFWRANIVFFVALLFIFINRVDIWKYLNYSTQPVTFSYTSTSVDAISKKIPDDENVALKIMELFPLYDEIVKDYESANPNTCNFVFMVDGCVGYRQCWTQFMKTETPLPGLVYTASKNYHETYGTRITSRLHEILKHDVTKSQYPIDLIQEPDYKEYDPYVKLNMFAGELVLEALLKGVDGDINGMIDVLKDVSTLVKTIDIDSKINFHRDWIMLKIAGFCEWYLNHIDVPEEVIKKFIEILDEVPLETCDYKITRLEMGRKRLFKLANSPKEYWSKFIKINKSEVRRLSSLANTPETLYERWMANIFMQEDLCNAIEEKYLSVLDLLGLRLYERRETDRCFDGFIQLWEFVKENGYVDHEQLKNLSKFFIYSYINYPLEEDRPRTYHFKDDMYAKVRYLVIKTALATELYRLQHNTLPPNLEVLFPKYMNEVPCDPWNNGFPLTIRKLNETGFIVYSYGDDGSDDGGGIVTGKYFYAPNMPVKQYEDIVSIIYPLDMRTQPFYSYAFQPKKEYE